MTISPNIKYDSKIFDTENGEIYKMQIEIASLNLDDFNNRLMSNITLEYNSQWNSFIITSQLQKYNELFVRSISHYLAYYNNRYIIAEEDFINNDLRIIHGVFYDLYYTLKEEKNQVSQEYKDDITLFLKRFDNYAPLGILSVSGEHRYKIQINKLVNSLNSIMHLLNE